MDINWWEFEVREPLHPLACFKGGGGPSGKIEYPAYVETIHSKWLDHAAVDAVTNSMVDLINAGQGNSPYAAAVTYDPDTDITAMEAGVTQFDDLVTLLSTGTGLDALISNILDDTRIDTVVAEFAADMDADLAATVYPRFEAGMRDINAVMSSAFVIGRAIIEDGRDRQVAGFSAAAHLKLHGDDAIRVIALKLQFQQAVSHMIAEARRVKVVMKKEQAEQDFAYDEKDARWDIELFQYGANLLAAPSGGTAMDSGPKGPTKTQSAIGGAMAGAGTGAMIGAQSTSAAGPWWGAAIGAIVGGIAGYVAAS